VRIIPPTPAVAGEAAVDAVDAVAGVGRTRAAARTVATSAGGMGRELHTHLGANKSILANKLGLGNIGSRRLAYSTAIGMPLALNVVGDVTGLSVWGDGADEDAVVDAFREWDHISQAFYEDQSQFITDNNLDVPTPTELLEKMYNNYATSEDEASTSSEIIDELDEFLEGSNLIAVTNQIERNNESYSSMANQSISESFTEERFSKLAGLLKG
jgi:hypothetical protein